MRVEEGHRVIVLMQSLPPPWRAPFLYACPPILCVLALRAHAGLGRAGRERRRSARVAVTINIIMTSTVIRTMRVMTTGMLTRGDTMPVGVVAVLIPSSAAFSTLVHDIDPTFTQLIPPRILPAAHVQLTRARLTRIPRPPRRIVAGGGHGDLTMRERRREERLGGASWGPSSSAVVVVSALTTVGVRVTVVEASMATTTSVMDVMRIPLAAARDRGIGVTRVAIADAVPIGRRPGRGRAFANQSSVVVDAVGSGEGGDADDAVISRIVPNSDLRPRSPKVHRVPHHFDTTAADQPGAPD